MKIIIEDSTLLHLARLAERGYGYTVGVELHSILETADKAEPVATVGTQEQMWVGFGDKWEPPGPPKKACFLLCDLPEGAALFPAPVAAEDAKDAAITDGQIVACLVKAECLNTVMMSYDSGPYDVTKPTAAAHRLVKAIRAAMGEK